MLLPVMADGRFSKQLLPEKQASPAYVAQDLLRSGESLHMFKVLLAPCVCVVSLVECRFSLHDDGTPIRGVHLKYSAESRLNAAFFSKFSAIRLTVILRAITHKGQAGFYKPACKEERRKGGIARRETTAKKWATDPNTHRTPTTIITSSTSRDSSSITGHQAENAR